MHPTPLGESVVRAQSTWSAVNQAKRWGKATFGIGAAMLRRAFQTQTSIEDCIVVAVTPVNGAAYS